MLEIRKITRNDDILPELLRLYRAAFPKKERVNFDIYLEDETGTLDILAFEDEGMFCGFSAMMSYQDLTQILYFAIEESLRGRGYGTQALQAMKAFYPKQRIMADLEDPVADCDNQPERWKRISFYERAGFTRTEVRFEWEHEAYEMMVSRGTLSMAEYEAFWRQAEKDRKPGYEKMDQKD